MKRLSLYGACLLFAPMLVQAQSLELKLATNAVQVENLKVEKTNNNLVVDMDVNMDSLDLKSNNRMIFTPVITNKEKERFLPLIVVNGRKQHLSFLRRGHREFDDDVVVVRRKNDTEQRFHYSAVVPFEDWMKNSNVMVAGDLCGCCDVEAQNTVELKRLRTPFMPYVKPMAEAQKVRHEEGRAFIDFPVDQITMYPEYRNNPREIAKIVETINLVKNDKNTTITSISIHGFASPESPYDHNAYLAKNRAKTLKDYVRNMVHIEDRLFTVASTPEDWAGLRDYVAKSHLKNQKAILQMIDDDKLNPDAKEWKIKSTYPEDYRFLLDHCYPALRHSDYVVTYSVRPFSVEEAKKILKTKPQQLSLEEMFQVAQTYEPGSREFNEVMETAVRLFPEDPTANINAACTRMQSGDLKGAETYLDKAGDSPQAWHAKGVLALLQNRIDEARQLLQKAHQAGAADADRNLHILDM